MDRQRVGRLEGCSNEMKVLGKQQREEKRIKDQSDINTYGRLREGGPREGLELRKRKRENERRQKERDLETWIRRGRGEGGDLRERWGGGAQYRLQVED